MSNQALIKVSLHVIGQRLFGEAARVRCAHFDTDDLDHGTVTLAIESEQLPPGPPEGGLINRVSAVITSNRDEATLVPKETLSVRFTVTNPAPKHDVGDVLSLGVGRIEGDS
jgi:hypothetical protein